MCGYEKHARRHIQRCKHNIIIQRIGIILSNTLSFMFKLIFSSSYEYRRAILNLSKMFSSNSIAIMFPFIASCLHLIFLSLKLEGKKNMFKAHNRQISKGRPCILRLYQIIDTCRLKLKNWTRVEWVILRIKTSSRLKVHSVELSIKERRTKEKEGYKLFRQRYDVNFFGHEKMVIGVRNHRWKEYRAGKDQKRLVYVKTISKYYRGNNCKKHSPTYFCFGKNEEEGTATFS